MPEHPRASDPEGSLRVVWSDAFSVGVPEIDGDHRVLFELIGQIEEAASGFEGALVTGSVLAALSDYVDYHFEREERVMRAISYPNESRHVLQHLALRRRVAELAKKYQELPSTEVAEELAAFLADWLNHHILDEDMGYRPYAENNPSARVAASSIGIEFFTESDDDVVSGSAERQG